VQFREEEEEEEEAQCTSEYIAGEKNAELRDGEGSSSSLLSSHYRRRRRVVRSAARRPEKGELFLKEWRPVLTALLLVCIALKKMLAAGVHGIMMMITKKERARGRWSSTED
jgi:hypothetical protein